MCRVFGGKFIAGSFLKLGHDILIFAGPVLLRYEYKKYQFIIFLIYDYVKCIIIFRKLIDFVNNKEQSVQIGLFYTVLMIVCSQTQSFLLQHYFHRMLIVGTRIRTSVMNIIYKKV